MTVRNPTFTVYCGPMFSSKTTRLLSDIERFKLQHKTVLAFKPTIDTRYSTSEIVSHSGWKQPAVTIKEGADILEVLSEADISPDVVALDEAFMVPGCADVLVWLYRTGVSIVVSTLDIGYAGKPFKEVESILPWATNVVKCSAVCAECGSDAFYTHKKQVAGDDEIQVGGSETYEPRCFEHHMAINDRVRMRST